MATAVVQDDRAATGLLGQKTTEEDETDDMPSWVTGPELRKHLAGSNLESLVAATALPRRDEGWLQPVPALVEAAMKRYFVGLMMLDQRSGWWLCGATGECTDVELPILHSEASQRRYTGYIQRFVCYALRVATTMRAGGQRPVEPLADACRLFRWNGKQKSETRELRRRLVDRHEMGGGKDDEYLYDPLCSMLKEFVLHNFGRSPFRSALVHFLALLIADQRHGGLRDFEYFSHMLAGMVYCGRAVAAANLLPAADLMQFHEKRKQYLSGTSAAPIGAMIRMLVHFRLRASDLAAPPHPSDAVDPDRFRRMVHALVEDAGRLLWQELLGDESAPRERITVPLDEDAENENFILCYRSLESSFVSYRGSRGLAADRILGGPAGRRLCRQRPLPADDSVEVGLMDENWRSHTAWARRWIIPERARAYLKRVERFMELLLLLSYITGGPEPTDVNDITGLSTADVTATNGQVMLTTSLDLPDLLLPWQVGQLMAVYLVHLRPFVEFLNVAALGGSHCTESIWADDREGVWEADRLAHALASETRSWLRAAITISDYRHVALAMERAAAAHVGKDAALETRPQSRQKSSESLLDPYDRALVRLQKRCGDWHRFLGLASHRRTSERSIHYSLADGHQRVIWEQQQLVWWLDDVMAPCIGCQNGHVAFHSLHRLARSPRCEETLDQPSVDWFQEMFWYRPGGPESCPRCGLDSLFCGQTKEAVGKCRWPQAAPMMLAFMAVTGVGREHLYDLGFHGVLPDLEGLRTRSRRAELRCAQYAYWLTAPCHRRVWGRRLSNAMAALVAAGRQHGRA